MPFILPLRSATALLIASRLAHAAGNVAVGDRLVTRIVGDEMGRVGVLDGAAVGEVEFAGFRIREIVRCEGGRGDGESHGRDGGEGEFLEHDVASLFSSSQYLYGERLFRSENLHGRHRDLCVLMV